jgi:hypothetical protein
MTQQAPKNPKSRTISKQVKRISGIIGVLLTIVLTLIYILHAINPGGTQATTTPMPSPTPTLPPCSPQDIATKLEPRHLVDLEDDASQWQIFPAGSQTPETLACVSSPGSDGTALQISLADSDIRAYINLPSASGASNFELQLSFSFPSAEHIQALTFSMGKWVGNQKWEWALQWENMSDQGPQAGTPPTWRIWDGNNWKNLNIMQHLRPNKWYKFDLKGKLTSDNKLHYISFSCGGQPFKLDQVFDSTSEQADKLAVAVELDADSGKAPYQVYIDKVDFQWS